MRYILNIFFFLISISLVSCGGGSTSNNASSTNTPFILKPEAPKSLTEILTKEQLKNLVALVDIGNSGTWKVVNIPTDSEAPIESISIPGALVDSTFFSFVYALRESNHVNDVQYNNDCGDYNFNTIENGYIPLSLTYDQKNININTEVKFSFENAKCYPDSDGDGYSNIEEVFLGLDLQNKSTPEDIERIDHVRSFSYQRGDKVTSEAFSIYSEINTVISSIEIISSNTQVAYILPDFTELFIITGKASFNNKITTPETREFIAALVSNEEGEMDWDNSSFIYIPSDLELFDIQISQLKSLPTLMFKTCKISSSDLSITDCTINIANYNSMLPHSICHTAESLCVDGKWEMITDFQHPDTCVNDLNNKYCTNVTNHETLVDINDGYLVSESQDKEIRHIISISSNNNLIEPPPCDNFYGCTNRVSNIVSNGEKIYYISERYVFEMQYFLVTCNAFSCHESLLTDLNKDRFNLMLNPVLYTYNEHLKIHYKSVEDPGFQLFISYPPTLLSKNIRYLALDDNPVSISLSDATIITSSSGALDDNLIFSSEFQTLTPIDFKKKNGSISIYRNKDINDFLLFEVDGIKTTYPIYPELNSNSKRGYSANSMGTLVAVEYDNNEHILRILTVEARDLLDSNTKPDFNFRQFDSINFNRAEVNDISVHINKNNEATVILSTTSSGFQRLTFSTYKGNKNLTLDNKNEYSSIVNLKTNKCLDIGQSGTNFQELAVQYKCDNLKNSQLWKFDLLSNNLYQIINKETKECLFIPYDQYDPITTSECNLNSRTLWKKSTNNSYFRLINEHTGKCLESYYGSSTGTKTANNSCTSYSLTSSKLWNSQLWQLN